MFLYVLSGRNYGLDYGALDCNTEKYELQVGDRVAAFHEMRTPGGSYAEYAVAWAHTTFHLPKQTSFEGQLNYKSCR